MMIKTKRLLPILMIIVIVSLFGALLFGCKTSNEQERQITNAFTPGKTQATANSAQPSETIPTQTEPDGITTETQPQPTSLPPDQPTMIVTYTQGLPIIVTQTRAATQPNQPVSTATSTKKPATKTATATTQPSNTPTPTKTLTPTVTLQTGWAGEWTFFVDNGSGGYHTGVLTITLNGKNVVGEAVINGSSNNFTGKLNADNTFILGDYSSGADQGWFSWVYLSDSQFGGTMDNRLAFCASRNGAERPGQCGHFVIS